MYFFLSERMGKLYNIAMENEPFEDIFPIENVDIPLLCYFLFYMNPEGKSTLYHQSFMGLSGYPSGKDLRSKFSCRGRI